MLVLKIIGVIVFFHKQNQFIESIKKECSWKKKIYV